MRTIPHTALAVVLFLLAAMRPAAAGPIFPLESLSPAVHPPGVHRNRVGLLYNEGERLLFQTTDRGRKVLHLPEVDVTLGVSTNMEVLLAYPFLYLKQEGQQWEYGSGDLRIGWIYRLREEGRILPETAIRFGVKLPNADDEKEFGTNETDFLAGGLFAKRAGPVTFLLNAEFAILGNPRTIEPSQDDVLFYKAAAVHSFSPDFIAGVELDGVAFSRNGNDRFFVRAGISRMWRGIILDAGAAAGLSAASGDFQIRAGVSYPFGVERREVLPLCR